ncbi:unnamed protein product, partial [Polarella glacialis]
GTKDVDVQPSDAKRPRRESSGAASCVDPNVDSEVESLEVRFFASDVAELAELVTQAVNEGPG